MRIGAECPALARLQHLSAVAWGGVDDPGLTISCHWPNHDQPGPNGCIDRGDATIRARTAESRSSVVDQGSQNPNTGIEVRVGAITL
jgi:hypothetical protein